VTVRPADSVSVGPERLDETRPDRHFRPDIEGLRAVAVLAVVLFHAAVPGLGGGYVGVDVFFVISGFLITGMLWRETHFTGTVRLRAFYGARARRLLPASAAVGVATMIGAAVWLPPLQARSALDDGIASALYVSNYQFLLRGVDYFAGHLPPSPFLHYWSLGVEEQFYLVWPPLILGTAWLIRRVRRASAAQATASPRPFLAVLIAVALISFALSFVATYVAPAAAFYALPTRAWQLALGGIAALTAARWRRMSPPAARLAGGAGLAAIAAACVALSPTTLYPGTAALLPTLGAVLVVGAGCAAPSRLLATAPLRAIGRISYAWYLWHWPVLIFAPLLVGHPLGLPARLTAATLAAGLAALTLRYLENPLRFAPALRASAWRSLAVGALATALAVTAGLGLLRAVPEPIGHGVPAAPLALTAGPLPQLVAQVQTALTTSAQLRSVPSNLDPQLAATAAEKQQLMFGGCLRSPFESGQPECAFADTASGTTVALIGDSHAAMWTPALEQLAAARQWRLELMAKGACPMMSLPIVNPLRRMVELVEHCAQWRADILTRLRSERPRLVVISAWRGYGTDEQLTGFDAYGPAWLDGLERLVRDVRDTGAAVLVLGPIPDPHVGVPVCLSGYLDDVAACTPRRTAAVDSDGIAAEAAATTAAGGHYADLTELFCTPDRCPVIVGNALVYLDENHLTGQYARVLSPVVGALADRALAGR
jgi:peptidoglycan/LPS O-acetylase OafA/YrhL